MSFSDKLGEMSKMKKIALALILVGGIACVASTLVDTGSSDIDLRFIGSANYTDVDNGYIIRTVAGVIVTAGIALNLADRAKEDKLADPRYSGVNIDHDD